MTPVSTTDRPLPHLTSWNRPFFAAGFDNVLKLQFCGTCRQHIYYPRPLCPRCGTRELDWVATSGSGTLYSYTIVWKPEHTYFLDQVPIVMGTVALAEGPMMFARVVDATEEQLAIGQALTVDFEVLTEEIALPVFRLAS